MVKMTTPSIDGLTDALKFPETRIRFPDEIIRAWCHIWKIFVSNEMHLVYNTSSA
jgi:hypothetical protein